jgi:hypothetical protein
LRSIARERSELEFVAKSAWSGVHNQFSPGKRTVTIFPAQASGASSSSSASSTIAFQIDVYGIALGPTERDPPVSAGVDRYAALGCGRRTHENQSQVRSRLPDVMHHRARAECGNPSRIRHAEPAPVSGREETLQGLISNDGLTPRRKPTHTSKVSTIALHS